MSKEVIVPLRSAEVFQFKKFLLISAIHSLKDLNDLIVQINTIPEGEKTFTLKERYKKTETIPDGKDYHFFQVMNDAPFIGAKEAIFNKEIEGGKIISTTITFF